MSERLVPCLRSPNGKHSWLWTLFNPALDDLPFGQRRKCKHCDTWYTDLIKKEGEPDVRT